MMAVWWVWIYTSWITNWLDPERPPVRLMLFVLMVAGLVMSASIPQAFGARGLAFAGAYVFMQVGRSLFMLWAVQAPRLRQLSATSSASSCGSRRRALLARRRLGRGRARFALWALALGIEYCRPPSASGCRASAVDAAGLEDRRRPSRRALRAVRHHRPGRIAACHRRHLRREAVEPPDVGGASSWPSSAASRCGRSISMSAPSVAANTSPRRAIPAGWDAMATPTCTS